MLLSVAVEQREGVAVCNGHDPALQRLSPSGKDPECQKYQGQGAHPSSIGPRRLKSDRYAICKFAWSTLGNRVALPWRNTERANARM
jgi:hypothetical protein